MSDITSVADLATELGALRADLQRILPPADQVDFSKQPAAAWHGEGTRGALLGIDEVHPIRLDDLLGIDRQKTLIQENTEQFVKGLPANDVLLWGARGTGKSSLIHALLDAYRDEGLRVIQIDKYAMTSLGTLTVRLREEPWRFIVFCDDLSFEADDAAYKALKSALDGAVFSRPANVLIYATSNRRHLLPESMTDNQSARVDGNELHPGEAVEEKISLSDRFGLWLSFYGFSQPAYLEVVAHWIAVLARAHGAQGLVVDEAIRAEALRWALARGNRSGRTAYHFASHIVGQVLLARSRGS